MSTPTPEQIVSYHKNGYLLLGRSEHNLVDPAALQEWTREVKSWPREKGKWMPYDEININGERQLMRTEKFVDYHPRFKDLLYGDALLGILNALAGEEVTLFKDKINYKQPHGNGFQAHLDAPAYDHIGYGGIEHITANFAIDAATLANGCLEVVPGSHKMSIDFAHHGRILPAWEEAHEWVSIPLEPGDVLIFGSHLAHRSKENQTEESRASLYATFAPVSAGVDLRERYYVHRMENFPPDHERVEGKDYTQGYKIYGFAAPFSKVEDKAVASH
ncbi:phytanoyl-CoA dioxygenase family protein [Aspergillus lucknowensis]|uniref:PhyH-domain-containing protein n=1 Tax=Aspergillus lucknowensis TaxID=176173 RepID=A0ABR4M5Y9_9EURO